MRIERGRIDHIHIVAEYMYKNAERFNLDKDEMYVLGLLHDIGYINGRQDHVKNGSILLDKLGFKREYIIAVNWHGRTPEAYKFYFDCTDDDIPKYLILLWEADNKVDSKGELVGYNKRLEDIEERYWSDSLEYKNAKSTVEWLKMMEI